MPLQTRRLFLSKIASAGAASLLGPGLITRAHGAEAGAQTAAENVGAAAGAKLAEPVAFSFDVLRQRAKELAALPFEPAHISNPDVLRDITYDQVQKIRYRPDMTLRAGDDLRYPIQLFHLSKMARESVGIHLVDNGMAQEVVYDPELFAMSENHPAKRLPKGSGFAGFRIMEPDLKSDWFAALGASYFRTAGPFDQYGISARGVAIDTALPSGEEFPRFTDFWIEKQSRGHSTALVISALLDGPSLTGAYRMTITRAPRSASERHIDMDITAELHARKPIARLGIAAFSSMFWYGEANRDKAVDWRPEIHDSDGLAILTGAGEQIWRPLSNPPQVMTNSYLDNNPKGFGLIQRDRDLVHYLDDGVFYEKRPSVWVRPRGDWGEGQVQLVEIPTNDETFDNIVAYWTPAKPLLPGQASTWRYLLSWRNDVPGLKVARVMGTWSGMAGRPGFARPVGKRKFVVDFQGPTLETLDRDSGVVWNVSVSRGETSNVYTHPVVGRRGRWRAFVDVEASGAEAVDIRGTLEKDGTRLGEVWQYQFFPSETMSEGQ